MVAAAAWYRRADPRVARDFAAELRHSFEQLTAFPEGAQEILGGVRRRVMRRFPYSIVYSIRNDRIRILALAHDSRKPFYWADRQ